MNIKRFSATDMREALCMIRDSLGPDAVIIETIRTAEGVEVAAAIDYDPALMYAASRDAEPRYDVASGDAIPAPPRPADAMRELAAGSRADVSVGPPSKPTLPASAGSGEDESVRCLLEARLSRLIWDDIRRRNPAMTNIMRNLSRLGLTPDIVQRLMDRAGDLSSLDNSWSQPLKWLQDALPVMPEDSVMRGGVFAVTGPTGVGKTTSVAKLAARFALRNGADGIALVSTDNFRVGAREQLDTFARIIGAPVYSVPDPARLDQTLASLSHARLVLIDTAGMGQRDVRLQEQLACLRNVKVPLSMLLALPANAQTATLEEIVNVFLPHQPEACILTKVDEATSLGGAFSALIRSQIPLAYICDGQRVPEDLHLAMPRISWLLKLAIDCMRQHSGRLGKDELAERFVKVAVNA